jgi:hypothetical protein
MDKANSAEYVAALCHMRNGALEPYESERLVAAHKAEAEQKAMEWAMITIGVIAEKTWLQVTLDGVGIYSKLFEPL